MGMRRMAIVAVFSCLALGACETPGQSVYDVQDVGQETQVDFGTVIAERPIHITGHSTGAGAAAGAGIGGTLMAAITGGNVGATLAGLLGGGGAGAAAETLMEGAAGIEYTVTLTSGKTVTVSQYLNKDDKLLTVGERVMVQTHGKYQRVLPADNLPTGIARPKDVEVHGGK